MKDSKDFSSFHSKLEEYEKKYFENFHDIHIEEESDEIIIDKLIACCKKIIDFIHSYKSRYEMAKAIYDEKNINLKLEIDTLSINAYNALNSYIHQIKKDFEKDSHYFFISPKY